ncbi:transglycosylase SLT domain-containing protein [Paenibacillus naphthalenovorans]|uniref:Transglycosylase SLT domain-containing protein n=1 Tax=Paenibacillus naphthalenovorans TaxID=162209 RepID=A0A0U2W6X1_9BACL|nr:transglycosylase SLT domain-containing protein [Paenibacillus naphthalenovorans]ALS22190.1 transglycosylase SLT domain-containing protein [Paenibacillus naphthalenovorans]
MTQITKQSLAIVLLSSIMITSCTPKAGEMKTENLKPLYESHIADEGLRNYMRLISKNISEQEEQNIMEEESKRPEINNIPLSSELLDYIYELCNEYEIPYTLALAIMAVESGFNPKAISPTSDYGIAQINKSNIHNFARATGIENVDPLNPKHNIQMQVYYLSYLKQKWSDPKYKFSEEQKYFMTVLAYNRGETKALEWVRNNGWNNAYVRSVTKVKGMIETNTYKNE